MKMNDKIQQLTMLEQNLNAIISQKQQFNKQFLDIENALSELTNQDEAYEIVGNVMIKKSSKDISKNLNEKKELIKIRLSTLTKQESDLKSQVAELQEEVMKNLDNKQ